MNNNKFDNIKIPGNIDSVIDCGAKKASEEKRRKKRGKYTGVAVALALITIVGVTTQPAIAQNIPILDRIYEDMGFNKEYSDVTKYVGKSVESNGMKITIDKLVATEKIIRMAIKLESENEIFDDPIDLLHISGEVNGVSLPSGGGGANLDKKTQVRVIDISSDEKLPSKGTIKINIYSEKHKINESIELNVDFTDSYRNNFKKEVEMESDKSETKVVEIEANSIGTILKVESRDYKKIESLLLKVDDKIYFEGSSHGNEKGAYILFDGALEEDIKNAKSISIMERKNLSGELKGGISIDSTGEEKKAHEERLEVDKKIYEENEKKYNEAKAKLPVMNKANIEYISELTSVDGDKVYISNVERIDGKIKVYLNGDKRGDMLRVLNSMMMYYEDTNSYSFGLMRETNTGYSIEFEDKSEGKVVVKIQDILIEGRERNFGEEIKLTLN